MNTFAVIILVIIVNSVANENHWLQLLRLICTWDALPPRVQCPNHIKNNFMHSKRKTHRTDIKLIIFIKRYIIKSLGRYLKRPKLLSQSIFFEMITFDSWYNLDVIRILCLYVLYQKVNNIILSAYCKIFSNKYNIINCSYIFDN